MSTNQRHIGKLIVTMWREFVDPTRDAPPITAIREHYEDYQHGIIVDYERTGRHTS
jgi:hypothetical protein